MSGLSPRNHSEQLSRGTTLLEDCRVPVANRLGAEGEGFKIAM